MITGSALALRTGAVIAATVAVAVLLSVALAEAKFDRTLRDVTGSRLSVMVDEVRRKVEYGLTLGLDLAELADVQGLVERTAGLEEVLDVQVVDEDAVVLFAAERAAVGHPSAITWTPGMAAAPGAIRQRVDGDRMILGATIRNSFGQTVGQVLLRSSLTGLRARAAEAATGLASVTQLLVAGTAAVTLAMVFAIVWRSGRLGDAAGQDALSRAVQWRLEHSVRDAERELTALRRDLGAS
ncbi:hypothetical protein [Azospirillum sp. sgz301742]